MGHLRHINFPLTDHKIDIVTYTEILEANLFVFAYKLFHEDFSPIDGAPTSSSLDIMVFWGPLNWHRLYVFSRCQ